MKYPKWLCLNLFSLDAVLVAGVWFIFFLALFSKNSSVSFETAFSSVVFFVLILSTWLIYTLDRIIDVSIKKNLAFAEFNTPRHQFHLRHKRLFWILFVIIFLANSSLVLFEIPRELIILSIKIVSLTILSLLVALIFPNNLVKKIYKALLCGFAFALACITPSSWLVDGIFFLLPENEVILAQTSQLIYLPTVFLSFLFAINCLAISVFEAESGAGAKVFFALLSLLIILTLASFWQIFRTHSSLICKFYLAHFLASIATVFCFFAYRLKFISLNQFRVFIDFSLLTPLPVLFLL